MRHDLILYTVLLGTGATVVMDVWMVFRHRVLGLPGLSWCLVGRWLGHMPRGTFRHESIAKAAPVHGECALGWIFHYAVGIAMAAGLVLLEGPQWTRSPTALPALSYGVLTALVPFFTLQPGIGAGMLASKTPNPSRSRLQSVQTHAIFGLGLFLSALALRGLPVG